MRPCPRPDLVLDFCFGAIYESKVKLLYRKLQKAILTLSHYLEILISTQPFGLGYLGLF